MYPVSTIAHRAVWRGIPLVRRDVSRLYNCTPSRLAWHSAGETGCIPSLQLHTEPFGVAFLSFHHYSTEFFGRAQDPPLQLHRLTFRLLHRLLHRLLDRLTFRLLNRLFAPFDVPFVAPIDVPFVGPSEAKNGSMAFFDDVTDIHKASPYVSNGHSWQHEHARRRRPLSALTGEEAGAQMNFQFSIFNFQFSKIFQFSIFNFQFY